MDKPCVDSLAAWRGLHLCSRPSKIRSDAELRALVDELLKTKTFQQVAAACLERFGPDRAPGKSAVHRYWQEMGLQDRPPSAKPDQKPRRRAKSRRSGRVAA